MIPIEVWETILEKINNPEDLTKLKLVCKDWYLLIENILNKKLRWKNHCLKLIPQEYVFQTFIQMSTEPMKEEYAWNSNGNNSIWQKIYYSWKKWQLYKKRNIIIDNIDLQLSTSYERIICLVTHHDILGITTNDGIISFYNIHNVKQYFYRVNLAQAIVQLVFWNTGDLIAVSRSDHKNIRFWDIHNQQEVKSIEAIRGNKIIIHLNGCYVIDDFFIHRYCYVDNKEIVQIAQFPLNLDQPISIMTTILYPDSILMVCSVKHSYVIKFYSVEFHNNGCELNVLPSLIFSKEHFLAINTKFYAFSRTMIVALFGPSISFYLNRIKWYAYTLFQRLRGIVTCVCYHCKLLMLGLDSGIICIYYVKNESDLNKFDFSQRNSKRIIVDNKPITSITVTDANDEQFIIAATQQNVHVIRFL